MEEEHKQKQADQQQKVTLPTQNTQLAEISEKKSTVLQMAQSIPKVIQLIFQVIKHTPDLKNYGENAKIYWKKTTDQLAQVLVQAQSDYKDISEFLAVHHAIFKSMYSFNQNLSTQNANISEKVELYWPIVQAFNDQLKQFPEKMSCIWKQSFDKTKENFEKFMQEVSAKAIIENKKEIEDIKQQLKKEMAELDGLYTKDEKFFQVKAQLSEEMRKIEQARLEIASFDELIKDQKIFLNKLNVEFNEIAEKRKKQSQNFGQFIEEKQKSIQDQQSSNKSLMQVEMENATKDCNDQLKAIESQRTVLAEKLQTPPQTITNIERSGYFFWRTSYETKTITTGYDKGQIKDAIQTLNSQKDAIQDQLKKRIMHIREKYEEIDRYLEQQKDSLLTSAQNSNAYFDSQEKSVTDKIEKIQKNIHQIDLKKADVAGVLIKANHDYEENYKKEQERIEALLNAKKQLIEKLQAEIDKKNDNLQTHLTSLGAPSVDFAVNMLFSIEDLSQNVQENTTQLARNDSYVNVFVKQFFVLDQQVSKVQTISNKQDAISAQQQFTQEDLENFIKNEFPKFKTAAEAAQDGTIELDTIYEHLGESNQESEEFFQELDINKGLQQKSWKTKFKKLKEQGVVMARKKTKTIIERKEKFFDKYQLLEFIKKEFPDAITIAEKVDKGELTIDTILQTLDQADMLENDLGIKKGFQQISWKNKFQNLSENLKEKERQSKISNLIGDFIDIYLNRTPQPEKISENPEKKD